jgi:RimJ/RimL family protein N-acetyltransferase
MFTCEGVTIRPLSLADRDRMYVWYLDGTVNRWGGWVQRMGREAFDAKWQQTIVAPPADVVYLGIEHAGELVGRAGIAQFDWTHRHAAIGIFLGDPASRGKGIATTALRLALDYAFRVENLERIYTHVLGFNEPSKRLMERVGLVHEAVLRRHMEHHGERHDVHVYGMLKAEFDARYKRL